MLFTNSSRAIIVTLKYRGVGGGSGAFERKTPSVVWRKCQLRFDRIKCLKHLAFQYYINKLQYANVLIIRF